MPVWAADPGEGPQATITPTGVAGSNGWWTSTVVATVTCAPSPCTTETRLDGGPWTPYGEPIGITAAGVHVLEARARNGAVEGPVAIARLAVDTAPPQSAATVSGTLGDNGWLTESATVTFACVDDASACASTSYSVDGRPGEAATGPVSIVGDGTHRLRHRATDHAGWNEEVQEQHVRIDATPPVLETTAACSVPGEAGWCRGVATAAFSASDATSGVAALSCQMAGVAADCDTLTAQTDGVHHASATARDRAGHTATEVITLHVDATPPSVQLTVAGDGHVGGVFTGAAVVTAQCADATSGCATLHLDDGLDTPWPGELTLTGDGTHRIRVFARDAAGNTGPVAEAVLTIDTTGPRQTHRLEGPRGDGDWFVGPTNVSLGCDDEGAGCARIDYAVDGGSTTAYDAPFVVSGDAPEHVVRYQSVDGAGHASPETTVRFGIDATAPQLAIHQTCDDPGAAGWCRGTISVRATASDGTSGIASTTCAANGGPVSCLADQVAEDGVHVWVAAARDRAGHLTEAAVPLRRDATPPTIDLIATCPQVGNDGWCGGPVRVVPSVSDPHAGVAATLCHQQGMPTPCASMLATSSGTTTFAVVADDAAGNRGARAAAYRVDLEPPRVVQEVTCSSGWNGDWCTGTVNVRVLASDDTSGVAALTCRLDGAAIPCVGHTVAADGRHDLVVQARDQVGHTTSQSVAFGVDGTPPVLMWSRPEGGCTYVADEPVACGGPHTVAVGSLTLVANGTDATSGVAGIVFLIDGRPRHVGIGAHAEWTWTEPDPVPADHRVRVQVADVAGNVAWLDARVARTV